MDKIVLNAREIEAILTLLGEMPGRYAIPLDHLLRGAAARPQTPLKRSRRSPAADRPVPAVAQSDGETPGSPPADGPAADPAA